ncbi:lysyl-tRNA synthetase, class II [Sporothrix schenckii 1099-18]|uniref:Probable lysine--tRNA ligase, cytoplasmic n=1 Tax=Sporothrix schenckii 1099-18 TaxID=1397361 RepID=A0A0F2LXH1_SPOSC|nr:lysyl-tRNA synthetase, class II [Sporothrix schenckii 1099-18]KJR81195.1 lysyl-tRNA synthetase, class II [Sporothrix schenckii 1099-18]
MADSKTLAQAAAPAPVAETPSTQAAEGPDLHLDDVTGERVSKTELKRRQKQRQRDEKKQQKAAEVAATAPKKTVGPVPVVEKDLDPREYYKIRCRQIEGLLKTNDPNPYPHKFLVDYDAHNFANEYSHLKSGEVDKSREIRLAGRIFTTRRAGNKLIFYDIRTGADTKTVGTRIQVMCQAQYVKEGGVPFDKQHVNLARGDVIGIVGWPGRTSPKSRLDKGEEGELSVFASEVVLLSPSLHMLPTEYYGFKDYEQRFRSRYLDLLFNDSSRQILWTRSKMIKYIRDFFDSREFIEVETPTLASIAGGATALPFTTHHNSLNRELFMRVAPELYLKMLIVGGFNKVFELGKNFRNEGVDLTHNPEFTSVEFYAAYFDVYDVMAITEELVSGLVKHLTGSFITKFVTQHGEEYEVNWEAPWKRIDMIPELERITGKTFPPGDELHTDGTNQFLKDLLKEKNLECPPPLTNARMLDTLCGEYLETQCISPGFILNHPQMMSPLAKYHRDRKGLCERFEAFVCRKEIANAYTERMRFEEQARQKAQGDDEAQLVDENFLRSLEYGLPPTGGWGLGIDRLAMFMTNNYAIREVISFPMLKEDKVVSTEKFAAEEVNVHPMPEEGIAHK